MKSVETLGSGAAPKPKLNQPIIRSAENSPPVSGRRAFFKYRDLGIEEATEGGMSATVTSADHGLKSTGWHYHVCDVQFIYMLDGWVELEFEGGLIHKLSAGESIYIPSGLKHNETRASQNFELIEIQVPAGMKTVPCDPPEGAKS